MTKRLVVSWLKHFFLPGSPPVANKQDGKAPEISVSQTFLSSMHWKHLGSARVVRRHAQGKIKHTMQTFLDYIISSFMFTHSYHYQWFWPVRSHEHLFICSFIFYFISCLYGVRLVSLPAFGAVVRLTISEFLILSKLCIVYADARLRMEDHYEEDPLQYKTTGVAARVGDLIGLQRMVWNGEMLPSLWL